MFTQSFQFFREQLIEIQQEYKLGESTYAIICELEELIRKVNDYECKSHKLSTIYEKIDKILFAHPFLNLNDISIYPPGHAPLLLKACESGNEKIVERLIKHGADVNLKPSNRASNKTSTATPLEAALSSQNINLPALMIKHGAKLEPNMLLAAVRNKYSNAWVHILIKKHGLKPKDIDLEEGSLLTELMIRQFYWSKHYKGKQLSMKETVKLLITSGVDINAQTADGETALSLAIKKSFASGKCKLSDADISDICNMLSDAGAQLIPLKLNWDLAYFNKLIELFPNRIGELRLPLVYNEHVFSQFIKSKSCVKKFPELKALTKFTKIYSQKSVIDSLKLALHSNDFNAINEIQKVLVEQSEHSQYYNFYHTQIGKQTVDDLFGFINSLKSQDALKNPIYKLVLNFKPILLKLRDPGLYEKSIHLILIKNSAFFSTEALEESTKPYSHISKEDGNFTDKDESKVKIGC